MNVGKQNASQRFFDITGSFADAVVPNEEGVAIFSVKAGSISIWIKEIALEKIK